jgi:hypothetical protein
LLSRKTWTELLEKVHFANVKYYYNGAGIFIVQKLWRLQYGCPQLTRMRASSSTFATGSHSFQQSKRNLSESSLSPHLISFSFSVYKEYVLRIYSLPPSRLPKGEGGKALYIL